MRTQINFNQTQNTNVIEQRTRSQIKEELVINLAKLSIILEDVAEAFKNCDGYREFAGPVYALQRAFFEAHVKIEYIGDQYERSFPMYINDYTQANDHKDVNNFHCEVTKLLEKIRQGMFANKFDEVNELKLLLGLFFRVKGSLDTLIEMSNYCDVPPIIYSRVLL